MDQNALMSADRGQILATLMSFANKETSQWLPVNHPAKDGQLTLSWPQISRLPVSEVHEAVALSIPSHCMDGWNFVARSMEATLAGDFHAARHLAYYAQLRAGMCILANLGIGIYNGRNLVINATGQIVRLDDSTHPWRGMGTHTIVWDALKIISSNSVLARKLLDLLNIRGVSLGDAIVSIWPGASLTTAASQLIQSWGLDLRRGKDEHRYRNISSYAAQAFNKISCTPNEAMKLIENIWAMFEPTIGSSCHEVDRYILRSVLQKQHRIIERSSNYKDGPIATRFDSLPSELTVVAQKDFLTGQVNPRDPFLLQRARSRSTPASHIDMISRAYLLLHAATSITRKSIDQAGLGRTNNGTRPWVDDWASDRGFWSLAAPIAEPVDLWEDIVVALEDLKNLKQNPATDWHDLLEKTKIGRPTITQAERICVWSLGA